MELHSDGSFRNMPRVKTHDKQQDSLLDATEMSLESRTLMAKILDDRLKDKKLWV